MDFRAERSSERGTSAVIRRVPIGIIGGNENSFRPIVLAVGPYNHGNENLRRMEACKAELIEKSPELKKFEPEVRELLSQIRCFYPPDVRARGQIDFEEVICRDVFFVVFVVYLYEKEVLGHLDSTNWFGITNFDSSMLKTCARNLLIADNQLPWPLVDKFSSLIFRGEKNGRFMINMFLATVMCENLSLKVSDDLFDGNPLHLLDLLRTRYLVDYIYPWDDGFVLYSAKELLMRRIKIVEAVPKKGIGFLVGGVCFCWKTATLALPRLSICEHFKHTFLNMAGYEPLAFVTMVKLPNFFACTEDCFRTLRV